MVHVQLCYLIREVATEAAVRVQTDVVAVALVGAKLLLVPALEKPHFALCLSRQSALLLFSPTTLAIVVH